MLVGAERERRKGNGATRGAAGVRTFAVTALLGAVGALLGGGILLAVVAFVVGMLAVVAYQRSPEKDPGMTTEISLLLTCLLGGLATRESALAAGIGAALAILLAARNRLHYFVRGVLTERELHDAFLFAAAALIMLPLSPDRLMGPFDAINPNSIARLVVLVMAIGVLGHVAIRSLGSRYGLPLAGFVGGFVSSTATIYMMGERAQQQPSQMAGAVAGAALSSVATIIQMAVIITLIQPSLLQVFLLPLVYGGLVACLYSLFFIVRKLPVNEELQNADLGRAFDLKSALAFATIVSAVSVLSAGLNATMGARGLLLASAISGLVDAHAAAASSASLAATNQISIQVALSAVLAGLSTNTIMKAIVAFKAGGSYYAARIVPGLVLMISAIWLGFWLR